MQLQFKQVWLGIDDFRGSSNQWLHYYGGNATHPDHVYRFPGRNRDKNTYIQPDFVGCEGAVNAF